MSSTVDEALAAITLEASEARALLRHVLGVGDAYLIAHGDGVLSAAHAAKLRDLAARRAAGEPLPYITGRREFYSLEFKVTPAVLIPRPETELLVEFALERIAWQGRSRVLDLGTGSGCVAISIARERPHAQVTAVDASLEALAVARENARTHATGNIEFLRSNWFRALKGTYDLIVANPPYVAAGDPHLEQGDLRFEPHDALVAGGDGLECIRAIVAQAPRYLERGAWLAIEHGYDQAARCRDLLRAAGLEAVFSRRDLAGIDRISGGCRAAQSLTLPPPAAKILDYFSRVIENMSVQDIIKEQVSKNRVVLYMKGSPDFPQCGFSANVVGVLRACGVQDIYSVNVLENPEIRQGIKEYANWPTIPQLYVNGEFVGGSDIVTEMHQSGELQKLLK